MPLLKDYKSVFVSAAFNSMLPEFMDSDSMNMNDHVSPEFLAVLRTTLDHYYKTPEITEKHIKAFEARGDKERARLLRAGGVDYQMVNDLFKQKSYYGTRQYEGIPTDIKMTLGRFALKRDPETGWFRTKAGGYEIRDVYDFASNADYLKSYGKEITETLTKFGASPELIKELYNNPVAQLGIGAATTIATGDLHPVARMFGGVFMSDQERPEEGGGMYVSLSVPPEDIVDNERPAPRPSWFEDENVPPVFPNTPMDDERKGLLDMAMDAIFSPAQADTAPLTEQQPTEQQAPVPPMQEETFKQAFARNRAAGEKVFEWKGNRYTTEVANG